MTDSTTCSAIQTIFQQRRENALYNIPSNRGITRSPYPFFTQQQLNMRRKVEILKYNSNTGNSKTNNKTKQQFWASLSRGQTAATLSQHSILSKTTKTCHRDDTLPTLTTSCDVPGPPIYLQYDPTVPVFMLSSSTTQVIASQGVNSTTQYIPSWNTYTTNLVDFFTGNDTTYTQDLSNNISVDFGTNTQKRSWRIGIIQITSQITSLVYTFSISIPVAFWCSGTYGNNTDSSYNIQYPMGEFASTDTMTFSVSNPNILIKYNDTTITPLTTPTISFTTYDVSFAPYSIDRQFYMIQYIGMMEITDLVLQTQPGYIYNIYGYCTYTYDQTIMNKFEVFQSGIFANIGENEQNVAVRCTVDSTIPTNYSKGSFISFVSENG